MNTTIKHLLTGRGILSLLLLVVGTLNAAAFDYDGITYQVVSGEEQTCSVTKLTIYSTEEIIPSVVPYNGIDYTVIGIEEKAISMWISRPWNLTIPNTLQYCQYQGFADSSKYIKELNLDIDDIAAWCEHPIEGLQNLLYTTTLWQTEDYSWTTQPLVRTKFNLTFRNNEITNLMIPMGVQTIAPYAFCGVQSIKSVVFPDDVESIGDWAFADSGLEGTLTLPKSLKQIGKTAFAINKFSEVAFSEALTEIANYAFSGNELLFSVKLPDSLELMGSNAFSYCTDLKEFYFGSHITAIPEELFRACERLSTVKFASEPESIGSLAFFGTQVEDIDLGNRLVTIGGGAFSGVAADIKIPSSVKNIEEGAFSNTGITSANLPNIENLGRRAFTECEKLTEINLGQNLTRIEDNTFSGCRALTSIILPSSITYIGESAFYRCSGSKVFDIPEGVTEIMGNALPGNIGKLHLHSGITSIAPQTIYNGTPIICDAMTPPALDNERLGFTPLFVLVPNGAGQAYRDNNRWSEYRIIEENGVTAVVHLSEPGTLAAEIRMQSGQFPANVTNLVVTGPLNDDDFAIMRSNMTACYDIDLSKVTNTTIPKDAFRQNSILLNLVLPEKTEVIDTTAFLSCSHLNIEKFPESLSRIGRYAFQNCYGLNGLNGALTIPQGVTEIETSAFSYCSRISSCNLEKTALTEINGYVFEGCFNLTEVRLPERITKIGTKAFSGSGIRSINLPESLSEIGENAFENCGKLSSIELPAGISRIGNNIFAGSGLVCITIPESITRIPDYAFYDCKNLMVVNFPTSLQSIDWHAFRGCTNMAAISSPAQEPAQIGANGFSGIDNYNCSLSIPTTSFTKYLIAEYWGAFVDIRNNIEVAVDKDIDVTYIDEADYQEMMEEEAEGDIDAARPKRSAALRAMREAGVVSAAKGYGRLFDGASLFVNEDASTRFFIGNSNVPDLKVVYDGRDITSQIDRATNSFVIDGLLKPTLLEITGTPAGIEEVSADSDTTGAVEYYDLNGLRVQGTLAPGIYIRRQGSHVSKIYVR